MISQRDPITSMQMSCATTIISGPCCEIVCCCLTYIGSLVTLCTFSMPIHIKSLWWTVFPMYDAWYRSIWTWQDCQAESQQDHSAFIPGSQSPGKYSSSSIAGQWSQYLSVSKCKKLVLGHFEGLHEVYMGTLVFWSGIAENILWETGVF